MVSAALAPLRQLTVSYATGTYRDVPAGDVALALSAQLHVISPSAPGLKEDEWVVGWVTERLANSLQEYTRWAASIGSQELESAAADPTQQSAPRAQDSARPPSSSQGPTMGSGATGRAASSTRGTSSFGHARNHAKADGLRRELTGIADVLVADLASAEQVAGLAATANAFGTFDAVIQNAGVGGFEPRRVQTEEGHAHALAINVLAPYLLTA